MHEVEATARRGYGVAANEAEPGVTALAAVVRAEPGGRAVGTLSIAGPSIRMTDARVSDLAPLVIAGAGELSGIWPLRAGR